MARHAIGWGLLVGAALAAAEWAWPKHKRWIPSPVGIGLGLMLQLSNPMSMFLGALLAWLWSRRKPEQAERYVVPVSSGIIAGESIVSVVIALINNLLLRR